MVDPTAGSDRVIALIGVLDESRIASCLLRRLISAFNEVVVVVVEEEVVVVVVVVSLVAVVAVVAE